MLLKRKHLVWAAAVFAAALLVFNSTGFRPVAQAQEGNMNQHTISVSGSGSVSGTPDLAYISLGVDQVDAEAGKAVDKVNSTMAAIIAAMSEMGIEAKDVQTSNYGVYPEDRYDQNGQPTVRVYHVQNTLNITVRDISKIGPVIDAGLKAGANTINSLSFGIANTAELEAAARKAAVADAQKKAQQLSEAFGVTLGAPITIVENGGSAPQPVMYAKADAMMMSAAPAQIVAGELSININISVVFGIS